MTAKLYPTEKKWFSDMFSEVLHHDFGTNSAKKLCKQQNLVQDVLCVALRL
jgi:hypothetical protein